MKILVLAALAVVTNGDVSHLASSGYNYKPPTSYGVPLNSVSGSAGNNIFSSITPTAPSNNIQLPVRGHESFNIGSSFGNKGTTGQLGTNFNTLTGSNGFGFGPSGFDNSDSSNFNQISSGLYSEPHKGGSFNLLSNLNSGYNYPSNTGSSGVSFENKNNFQPTQTEVSKHLYFFSAPDEPASLESRVQIPVAPAKKNVKIIFIKTPSFAAPAPIQIPVQQQNQEKTIVYVLVKKPEEQAPISIPEAVPTVPAKPEVYFIKYKTQKEAEEAISQVQTGASNAGASISANPVDNEQGFISTINTQSSGNQPSVTFVNTGAQSGVGFLDDRNNFPSSNVGSSNVGIGSGCDSNSDGSSLNLNCNNGGGSPRPENIGSGTGDSGSFLSGQKPTTETVHQQYGVPKF